MSGAPLLGAGADRRPSLNSIEAGQKAAPGRCCASCGCCTSDALVTAVAVAGLDLATTLVLWAAAFRFDLGTLFSDAEAGWTDYCPGLALADVALACVLRLLLTATAVTCCRGSRAARLCAAVFALLCTCLLGAKLNFVLTEGGDNLLHLMRVVICIVSAVLSTATGCALLYSTGTLTISVFDLVRYIFSTLLSAAAAAFIIIGIQRRESVLPAPPVVLWSVFTSAVTLLWHLEGVQVAILAVEGDELDTFERGSRAQRLQRLMIQPTGVKRFLVGRQFFVIFVVYLTAQVTTFPEIEVPLPQILISIIVDTGLPGVLLVLAIGQLMPQLMAASDPKWFMNLPGCLPTVYLCLAFELIGITHFAWLCSHIANYLVGLDDGPKAQQDNDPGSASGGGGGGDPRQARLSVASLRARTKITFGKHVGSSFAEVQASDPTYCRFVLNSPAATGQFAEFQLYLAEAEHQLRSSFAEVQQLHAKKKGAAAAAAPGAAEGGTNEAAA